MEDLQEIEGTEGVYKIQKIKLLYEIGYTSCFVYIRNLETNEIRIDWR